MQKKLLVSLLVSLALSVPAGYAVYLLTDSDFLSPGILRLMQALAVLLLIFIWGEFALLVRDARRNAHHILLCYAAINKLVGKCLLDHPRFGSRGKIGIKNNKVSSAFRHFDKGAAVCVAGRCFNYF